MSKFIVSVSEVETKAVVNQDNVRVFDSIMKTNGVVESLDYRPYIEFCEEFNIDYTIDHGVTYVKLDLPVSNPKIVPRRKVRNKTRNQ